MLGVWHWSLRDPAPPNYVRTGPAYHEFEYANPEQESLPPPLATDRSSCSCSAASHRPAAAAPTFATILPEPSGPDQPSTCPRGRPGILVHMPPKRRLAPEHGLQDALQSVQTDLMELQRELRLQRRRKNRQEQISPSLRTCCQILLCRSSGSLETLIQFLVHKCNRPKVILDAWTSDLASWYTSAGGDVRSEFLAASSSAELQRAAKVVDKFSKEKALHGWVHQRNVATGIAPASQVVAQQLHNQGLSGSPVASPKKGRHRKHTYQYLRRWRRRWKVEQGTLSALSGASPTELSEKVGRMAAGWADRRRPVFRPRSPRRAQKCGHFPAAEP